MPQIKLALASPFSKENSPASYSAGGARSPTAATSFGAGRTEARDKPSQQERQLTDWSRARARAAASTRGEGASARAARSPPLAMLRWLIGGGREPQGLAEVKGAVGVGACEGRSSLISEPFRAAKAALLNVLLAGERAAS